MAQGQMDQDYNSVGVIEHDVQNVQQVYQRDNSSTTSSMTDITNNTVNNAYHNTINDSSLVTSYDTSVSLKSINNADLAKYITPNM